MEIQQFCGIDDPRLDSLVIDFRELDYQWGDDLSIHGAWWLLVSDSPVLVVVSPDSLRAYAGVLNGQRIRTDFHEALEEVEAYLQRT
ncbi:hypothetical protein [Actinomadura sp. 6N118]|uniref:hypothetical protein n=1 Tax=Actinomadura sp. 6N118 TaxID=3375151 RepID=UPI0037B45865